VIVAGEFPSTFEWAEQVHARMTPAGRFQRVAAMKEWAPSL
jgi:hypothetical protein